MSELWVVVIFLVIAVIYAGAFALSIAMYIMTSLSMYTIAKNRGIDNAWLAWIPIGDVWILGSIVDYHDERRGVAHKWRVVLMTLSLISGVGFVLVYILMFVTLFVGAFTWEYYDTPPIGFIVGFIVLYIAFLAAIVALSASQICRVICLYKIYDVLVPEKAVKYTLVSLMVPLGEQICLMKCRNSQNGILPPPVYPYYAPPIRPSQECDSPINGE